VNHAVELRNAQLDQITVRAGNAALLRAYDGTKPATGGPATTKLAEWTLGTPFAAGAAAGVLSPTLPADTTGLSAGQVTWFRIVKADGTTHVTDLNVSEVSINNTNITIGAAAKVTSFTITAGNA
jgi:cytoskeletal protein RodZ